jgi:excisionase family DNA binding protein
MSVQKQKQQPSMQDSFSHKEVFGYLKDARFSGQEAAEYLEISMPTFRRYVQSQKIKPVKIVGRSQLFAGGDIRKFKESIL